MITFTPLRTRRLAVSMQELSIGDAIYLCGIPPHMHEAGTTALLHRICSPERHTDKHVTDVRLWTVQERALAVAHYLAHTEGEPNFQVGERGHFADYLLDTQEVQADLHIGMVGGDEWYMRPLLGIHAEAIERLMTTGQIDGERAGWWMAAMSVQLRRGVETFSDTESDAELEDFITSRIAIFRGYPERDFMDLLALFLEGTARLDHHMRIQYVDDGIAFAPVSQEVPGLPPARFPFDSAIFEGTRTVFGKPDPASGGAGSTLQPDD